MTFYDATLFASFFRCWHDSDLPQCPLSGRHRGESDLKRSNKLNDEYAPQSAEHRCLHPPARMRGR
jgi:hypothetical protein